jgi:hypothetical protein
MRRTAFVLALFVLLVPAAAWAGKSVLGDGTLSVRNGDGMVRLDLDRGVVIGRLGSGTIQLFSTKDAACATPLVWDAGQQMTGLLELKTIDGVDGVATCTYRGESLRFRLLGSDAGTIRLSGDNLSLSAVGRGKGQIKGRKDSADGTWSLNGTEYTSLPDERQGFRLLAPNPVE